jgi:hypothetical protein
VANDISARPWKIDTANANVIIWPSWMDIEHIEFSGYSTQGSVAQLVDRNGRIVWTATGTSDLQQVRSGKVGHVNGLICTACENGGVILVYVK